MYRATKGEEPHGSDAWKRWQCMEAKARDESHRLAPSPKSRKKKVRKCGSHGPGPASPFPKDRHQKAPIQEMLSFSPSCGEAGRRYFGTICDIFALVRPMWLQFSSTIGGLNEISDIPRKNRPVHVSGAQPGLPHSVRVSSERRVFPSPRPPHQRCFETIP